MFASDPHVYVQGKYWTKADAIAAWRSGAEFTTAEGQKVSIRDYPFRSAPPETRVRIQLLNGGCVSIMEHEDGSWDMS